MRTLSVAAVLAALTTPTIAAELSPSAIRAMLEQQDAATFVQSLDEPSWTAFLNHLEAGERGWIDLVPLLAPGAAGTMSDSLAATLSRALKANPAGVLSVLATDYYGVADICGLEDGDGSTFDTVRRIDETLVKVAAVIDPDLSGVRDACLSALGSARISALI